MVLEKLESSKTIGFQAKMFFKSKILLKTFLKF